VTDWRSATPEMRFFSIDTYLADLNVAVDELTPPVDLVGLCQGGWLALVYAARFPGKVRRLVLAGVPVDVDAAESPMSRAVRGLPLSTFESLVRLGDGRVLGRHVREAWAPALDAADVGHVLQVPAGLEPDRLRELEARFRHWYAWTVDLPGPYYLQAVDLLYRQNQIAQGRFVALGRRIDLADVRAPLFLLAARDDEIVPAEQLFATAHLVGSADGAIETAIEPCGHLGLFLGAGTLGGAWMRIAHWLSADRMIAKAS
jgi:poly(3-hydroxyalkanoate) synthetase